MDTAALVLPVVPGGVGTIIKGARAADTAVDAIQTVNQVSNAAQAANQAANLAQELQTLSRFTARYGDESVVSLRNTSSFQKFAQWSFRENLARLTGFMPTSQFEAHHVLPQNFAREFEKAGFIGDNSIHNPIFGSWVEKSSHQGWSRSYQDRWQEFFDRNSNATRDQVLDFAKQLGEEFGFDVNFP